MDLGLGWRPWKRQLPWHGYLNARRLVVWQGEDAGREGGEEEAGWGRANARQINDPRRCSAACHVGSYLTDSAPV